MNSLAVLAIGGNSLIKDKDHIALSSQYEAIQETSKFIAELIAEGQRLIITHGNGPQVGFIYRRGELARHELPLIPLDICGADTQGAIGYMIQMALLNEFRKLSVEKKVAAVVTKVIVDRDDPSFQHPSKPIGSFMSEEEATLHRKEAGWQVMEDAGRGFRRVVPSPIPIEIVELDVVRLLVEDGYIVIAAGGGGIPVIRNEQGDLEGVEAVIDKDMGSSLLARNLGADTFIISTSVDAVYLNFGQVDQKPLRRVSLSEIKKYLKEGHFKPGSMRPKIEAIIQFLEGGGEKAIITSPENLLKAVKGEAGTTLTA
ncbi:MAG: carbamate kinase [Deltaproteobacteria bacterium RBG_16_49_23]|nr:MAG: carbamate kinase [Deltaproteobacteria bacterium RBG_16_49_23]